MFPTDAAVWFEIPVSDFDRARAFYAKVLQNETKVEDGGPNPMAIFVAKDQSVRHRPPLSRHSRPPAEPAAPSILPSPHRSRKALERVTANGGEVVSPIITIPAGRFAYCLDLDGNSFGLFN